MEEAQAALAASIRSLTEADQRHRAPAAIRTNSQAPRQDMLQQRQPASPHMMQQRQPLSPHMQQNSVQPGHVQRAAQFLQPRSPAAMQPQPAHAVASASHPMHASNQTGSYGLQPHQLPPVTQQSVQPSRGQPASEWRSVADVPQRQVSFEGLPQRQPQRQPQPGPTAATSSAYNGPATATTSSAYSGPTSGGRVSRSMSGPEAYWPPGEHAGRGTRQQLSRSSNSSVASQSPHAFSAVAGTAAQALASGSGRSFDGLGGISGGSPTSQQRHPAAAELAPEASLPASLISGDEGSLLGVPWQRHRADIAMFCAWRASRLTCGVTT